jgi:EAL domain-containing protein (putative c-di-GMP-specific phosphodiesterase class I)
VTRRPVLAHIVRDEDGIATGVWGPFTLKSAFQPIFAFQDGKLLVAAFEGLIRPFRGDEAIGAAAFFAALPTIDKLFVENLTRTLHLLNAGVCLPKEAAIFVNFDPSLFVDKSIAEDAIAGIRLTLASANIDPRRIVCEVTEQKSTSLEELSDFVQALRRNGFRIAVDDYGSEDSDIERIKTLRPEIVKFDAHWITRLMETGPGLGLLSAMVEIFAGQGIDTVFEGIEESWQLDLAQQSGASMVQGFVLARPELAPTNFSSFPLLMAQHIQADTLPGHDPTPGQPGTSAHTRRSFGRRASQ